LLPIAASRQLHRGYRQVTPLPVRRARFEARVTDAMSDAEILAAWHELCDEEA
jgi:hypothetical protein